MANPYDPYAPQPGYAGPPSRQDPLPTGTTMYDSRFTGASAGFGPASAQADLFTSFNPANSVRPFFGQLGYSQEGGTPWVKYYQERVAPGLAYMYALQNPAAGGTVAASGFGDWMRANMAASIGRGGAPMRYGDFINTVNALLGRGTVAPGSGNALYGQFGSQVDPDDQFQNLQRLLGSGAAMTMTGLAQQSMMADLRNQYETYLGLVNTGAVEATKPFRDWLADRGWFAAWQR